MSPREPSEAQAGLQKTLRVLETRAVVEKTTGKPSLKYVHHFVMDLHFEGNVENFGLWVKFQEDKTNKGKKQKKVFVPFKLVMGSSFRTFPFRASCPYISSNEIKTEINELLKRKRPC